MSSVRGGKGIDTALETISRWAPSNENNTQAYAYAVDKRIGVQIADPIDIKNPATCAAWCWASSSMRTAAILRRR